MGDWGWLTAVGVWNWPAIGTAFGVVANVIVIAIALWQGRVTARSAQSAAESAKMTEQALELQQESYRLQQFQWDESKRAYPRILGVLLPRREVIDGNVFFWLPVTNVGKAPAFHARLWTHYRGTEGGHSTGHAVTLMPGKSHEFRAHWNPPDGSGPSENAPQYWVKLVLSYEDGTGPHQFAAYFQLWEMKELMDTDNPNIHAGGLILVTLDGVIQETAFRIDGVQPKSLSEEQIAHVRARGSWPPDDL